MPSHPGSRHGSSHNKSKKTVKPSGALRSKQKAKVTKTRKR